MKKARTSLVLLFLALFAAQLPAQNFDDAIDYNDYIVDQQDNIARAMMSFNEAVASETATFESVQPYYNSLSGVTGEALRNVKALPAYKGNTQLRDASAALFQFYYDTFTNQYKEMMELLLTDNPTEEDFSRVEAIMAHIQEEEPKYDAVFSEAQEAFAKEHNFTLEENEMQEKLDGDE